MLDTIFSKLNINSNDTFLVALIMTLIVVGALLLAGMIFATVTKLIVAFTYIKYNKVKCQNTQTAQELTRNNLNSIGLNNVEVKKSSWLRSLLGLNMQGYGNSYSAYKKSIYLRKNIVDKNSVTAYAVSTQKVAHAQFDSQNKYQFYYKVKPFLIFMPVLVLPFTLIGLILDAVNVRTVGLYTITFATVSLILFLLSFVLLLITIPIEKRANKVSEELLQKNNLVTQEELKSIKKVNNAYILSYISDFIYAVLQIIWDILKILLKVTIKARTLKK